MAFVVSSHSVNFCFITVGKPRCEFVFPPFRPRSPTRSQSFSVAVLSAAVRVNKWPRSPKNLQPSSVPFSHPFLCQFPLILIQKGKQAEQPVTNVGDTPHSEPKQPVPESSDAFPPNQPSTQQQPGPVPAQQPTTTTTTTVTTTNGTPKPSTSADTPVGDRHVVDEKDKGSLSTSAGTRTHSGLKGNKSSSEGALSASDATATSPTKHEKTSKPQVKQSFLNKLVRALIPCVVPSSRTHDVDPPADAQPTVAAPAVKEKQGSVGFVGDSSSPTQNGRTTEPAQSSNQTSDPSTSSAMTPPQLTPRSDTSSQSPEDVTRASLTTANDLTVAPTPSKTLSPVADPEGVTSGGVQLPGSRGDDVVHTRTHSQDSGDESDATTTFTEEDDVDGMNALDEMEDEEERLIMNGGVGIPIGPVCIPSSSPTLAFH